ncbi:hypothetical protein BD779DRAFT_1705634 [Infundibulicybe gibba]|nr:hypothetical protein BD779DRAFT_1705634 [Infundibulicybe gibba]
MTMRTAVGSVRWGQAMNARGRTDQTCYLKGHVGEWLPRQPQWQHWGELWFTQMVVVMVVVGCGCGPSDAIWWVVIEASRAMEVDEANMVEERNDEEEWKMDGAFYVWMEDRPGVAYSQPHKRSRGSVQAAVDMTKRIWTSHLKLIEIAQLLAHPN